jgi:hypothetical protein
MRRASASPSTKWHMHSVSFPKREMSIAPTEYPLDAFIRDELSKSRYDPAISRICFEMLLELFGRTLKSDLGPHDGGEQKIENVC